MNYEELYKSKNLQRRDYSSEIEQTFLDAYEQRRGVMLMGDVGTGKTTIMKTMAGVFKFRIIECRHVARELKIEGDKILDYYGRNSFVQLNVDVFDRKSPLTFCFDDMGITDAENKYYGNEVNVMSEILHDRYNHWQDMGMLTYITTNKDSNIIEKLYGKKCRDRMGEMMQVISLTGESWRRKPDPTIKCNVL